MEKMKALEDIMLADIRSTSFVHFDDKGTLRKVTLSDHFESVSNITLDQTVPENVVDHFQTAKNVLLYSWYVYRFIPVAELYAIISLEYALKIKTKMLIPGFRNMMEYAITRGWWKKENFSRWQHINSMNEIRRKDNEELENAIGRKIPFNEYKYDFMGRLPGYFEYRRNDYAHGTGTLAPGGHQILAECAEAINQLFHEDAIWDSSELQNEKEFENFIFLKLYSSDLNTAKHDIQVLEQHKENKVRFPILMNAIVCYARPFSSNRGKVGKNALPNEYVPKELKETHDLLLKLRNQQFAHTDLEYNYGGIADFSTPAQKWFPMSLRRPPMYELDAKIGEIKTLFAEVEKRINEEIDKYEEKLHRERHNSAE